MSAYPILLAEATRLGLPQHYQTDLTRVDKGIVEDPLGPKEFVWVLREMGTFIVTPQEKQPLPLLKCIYDYHGDFKAGEVGKLMDTTKIGDGRWYIFADGKLRHVTYEQAKQWLTKAKFQYERSLVTRKEN